MTPTRGAAGSEHRSLQSVKTLTPTINPATFGMVLSIWCAENDPGRALSAVRLAF